jgi:thymidylate synthase (FAD)
VEAIAHAKGFFDTLSRELAGDLAAPELAAEPQVELLAATPDAERVIEQAGRTCYRTEGKITDDSAAAFVRMLVERKHESVLEHSYAVFRIRGGSRAFTHQLVRHRLASISQQSQRYVDEKSFRYIRPPSIDANPKAKAIFDAHVALCKAAYLRLQELGCPNEDARYVLPNAVESEIVIGANFREWRHIFRQRCYHDAQWEIKAIALKALRIMMEQAPNVFCDFEFATDDKGHEYAYQKKTAQPGDGQ